ncbi:MAG TPA: thioredoxin domain-containing protein [Candidatus Limnocylindria bacterium]|nr:thioredoxin domain-containing protein [Candidatus Limnocylindria bacterium]
MAQAAHRNRLADETSPYLLQHAHNPVDWYPWGAEALDRARELDRPIFLSIGYAACHWCHVMERESFMDEEIAKFMNENFVCIKVDREERPDIDELYMAAVQAMTGSGGWPLNVFLTPSLEPFFGGTYFPPADRHGLPSFTRVLEAIHDAYATRRDEVAASAAGVTAHLRNQLEIVPGTVDPQRAQLDAAVARIAAGFDPTHGGFGPAPKFPAPMTLEFLLRAWRRSGDAATLHMVTRTLDAMADGGIWDHLGGGFARYATDARWLVPHFEKMLYDNALLAHAYLEAFRATRQDRYARTARETLDFMLAQLRTDEGGFASALDADSEGEEGRFYAWTDAELRSALDGFASEEIDAVAAGWGVTAAGNWEAGRNVLHRPPGVPFDDVLRERARTALLRARAARVRPGRDDKQLAAWNGMALRALAHGAVVLGERRYADAARELVGFVERRLLRDGDRLWRTARDGRAHTPGFGEDYLHLADGLLASHAALGDAAHLDLARRLVERAAADLWDDEAGVFAETGPEHEASIARVRSLVDGAVPSTNSVAADVLQRLALLTGDAELDRRARRILRSVAPALDRQPTMFGRMLAAADRSLDPPIDAVVAASRTDDPAAAALRAALAAPYLPNLVLASVGDGDPTARWPIFEGKVARDGAATAYVCRGYACEAPTTDPAAATAQVEALSRAGS